MSVNADIKHTRTLTEHEEVDADFMNAMHKVNWVNPCEEYLPLWYRTNQQGLIYFNDPYIITRCHASVTDQYISWLVMGKTFDFGTYECKAKASHNALANALLVLMGFERTHGWTDNGLITISWNGAEWHLRTVDNDGNSEATAIAGVDFTIEHTLKIEWTSTYVKAYIDGILKATNSTHVPQLPMQLFNEIAIGDPAPAEEPLIYFRNHSFKEL